MAVNTEHKNSNVVITRISRLTQHEKAWIEALHRSGLDLKEPFTAREATDAIARTPLTTGGPRIHIPNSMKLCYVMKKTKKFERLDIRNGNRKVFWRLYDDQ